MLVSYRNEFLMEMESVPKSRQEMNGHIRVDILHQHLLRMTTSALQSPAGLGRAREKQTKFPSTLRPFPSSPSPSSRAATFPLTAI